MAGQLCKHELCTVCETDISSKSLGIDVVQVDSYESVESATSQVSPTKDDSFDEGTRSYLLPAPPLISAFQDLAQQASPRPIDGKSFPLRLTMQPAYLASILKP